MVVGLAEEETPALAATKVVLLEATSEAKVATTTAGVAAFAVTGTPVTATASFASNCGDIGYDPTDASAVESDFVS